VYPAAEGCGVTTLAWNDLTKAEQAEVRRLNGRHRDIRLNGAGALEAVRKREDLQRRRQEWVAKYGLACFGCGATVTEWAKLGVTNGRRWCVCKTCVRRPK
jgi:hypothetical protein